MPKVSPPGSDSSEWPTLPLPVATHIGVLRVQSEGSLQKGDNKEAHGGWRHQALCENREEGDLLRLTQQLFGAKTWSSLSVED